jgi:tetratricopeptide (TPR) repeat protein
VTPDRWREVKEVMAEAVARPPGERTTYLSERCGEDLDLRAEVASLLEHAGEDTLPAAPARRQAGRAGSSIGPYRLEELIGEGGMGAVYLATRAGDGFTMRVALKILRVAALSEYSLKRFRMERQIMARLEHPNIPRLIDGGVTDDGLPYLVSELVEGTPLDQWRRDLDPSLRERLRVFLELCGAVNFAHRSLIVHGDIKPGNVLVTRDGHPKLLDFGIARLLERDGAPVGATTTFAMTPAWASPEQLNGEPPRVASDVYSLGRLLYELIAESPPFVFPNGQPRECLEVLRNPAPPPSSAPHSRVTPGDLDNITLKAIAFDTGERYHSVAELAADVRNFLELRPVAARAQTWTYRASKFVARNRREVIAGAVLVTAVIVLFAVALSQTIAARRNYESAARQSKAVRELANSFLFELDDAVAERPGATQVRARIMARAIEYLDRLTRESANDPALESELALAYQKVGDIMGRPGVSNLGRTAAAIDAYKKAEDLMERRLRSPEASADDRLRLADLYQRLSAIQKVKGDFHSGLDYDLRSLDIRREVLRQSPRNQAYRRTVAQSLTSLGGTYSQLGDWPQVRAARTEALSMFEELEAANPANLADRRGLVLARTRLASILSFQGEHAAALAQLERAMKEQRALAGENPANAQIRAAYGSTVGALARALGESGDLAGAIARHQEARAIYAALAAEDDADVRTRSLLAATDNAIARLLVRSGKAREALPYTTRALGWRRELSNVDPENSGALGEIAESEETMGDTLRALGQRAKARQAYEAAAEILRSLISTNKANAGDKLLLSRVEAALAQP